MRKRHLLAILPIAGLLLFATACAYGTNTNTATTNVDPNATNQAVSIAGMAFSPQTLSVKVGTTVTWTNSDSVTHTVTGNNGGPSSSNLSSGTTYSYTFNTAGSFPYHCAIHPSMTGTVTVTN